MSRLQSLLQLACFTVALAALPARAQNVKPAAPAEVDPDAATYSTAKEYTPPGVLKSVEIGDYYFKKKKYNAALSRYQEAIQQNPTYAPAFLGLGKVYDKIGLKQKALDAYKKYLD